MVEVTSGESGLFFATKHLCIGDDGQLHCDSEVSDSGPCCGGSLLS